MPLQPDPCRAWYPSSRRRALVALSISLVALLAAMPTASAIAGSTTSSQTIGGISAPALGLPVGELEPALASLPLGDLGLSEVEFSEILKRLNPGLVGELLGNVFKNPNATLGELVSTANGVLATVLGKNIDLGQIFAALDPTQVAKLVQSLLSAEGVAKLLGGLTGKLGGAELQSLEGVLAALTGALSGSGLGELQGNLQTLLLGLGKGELKPILEALEGVLGGTSLAQLESLLGDFGSLSQAGLQEALHALLGTLEPAELSGLLDTLFGTLGSSSQLETTLKGLLGDLGPVTSTTTPEELANAAGPSVGALAKDLGTSTENLPATLPAASAPLGVKGPLLSLLGDLGGLKLGTQGGETGGGAGGSGQGGAGSQGGVGGQGAGLTLVVNSAQAAPISSTAAKVTTKKQAGAKLEIVGHRVKGKVATVTLQVPAAGRVTLGGSGVKSAVRKLSRAGRVKFEVKLSKAGTASLRRHHNRLKVKLRAAFKSNSGTRSSATVNVTFR